MNSTDYFKYLAPACEISREAGKIIMGYFRDGFAKSTKTDNSPVTEADIAANEYIIKKLAELAPHIPIIAEEDETLGSNLHDAFFLVDPLDGTRSFVQGEPEFTVNIGLIVAGKPVFGVIYCPPQEILYYGIVGKSGEQGGAYKQIGDAPPQKIQVRPPPAEGLTVVRSRSHPSPATNEYLQTLKIHELISGSSSVKLCMVAEGAADIYPRFGRTMEWDIAAGDAILQAAGGRVETVDGQILQYGKKGFENPFFIAFGE
jgi:3'(2'), 5'-bisphosphate nucleotidase